MAMQERLPLGSRSILGPPVSTPDAGGNLYMVQKWPRGQRRGLRNCLGSDIVQSHRLLQVKGPDNSQSEPMLEELV